MGILCLCREGLNMIKFVASACLVAAALADADPYYGAYGYGGYGLGYAAAVPFGSSTGLDPITQVLDASTQGYAPYAAYGGYYGKRSADPYYGAYGVGLGYAAAGAYGYYGKRSADAYYPYGVVAPYAYGAPAAYAGAYAVGAPSTGLDPITQGADPITQGADPVTQGVAYAKRSADPYYGAYGLGYAAAVPFGSSTGLDPITQGLDASTQGYAPYAAYGAYGYYGKRSADPYYGA